MIIIHQVYVAVAQRQQSGSNNKGHLLSQNTHHACGGVFEAQLLLISDQ